MKNGAFLTTRLVIFLGTIGFSLSQGLPSSAFANLSETLIYEDHFPTLLDLSSREPQLQNMKLRMLFNSASPQLPNLSDPATLKLYSQIKEIHMSFNDTPHPLARDSQNWELLRSMNLHLALLSSDIPQEKDLETINQIQPKIFTLALSEPLSKTSAKRLLKLTVPFQLTLNLGRYPKYMEKFAYDTLPETTSILFVTTSWPFYLQTDTLNLFPLHHQRLRIVNTAYVSATLDFIKQLNYVETISFQSDGSVDPKVWNELSWYPNLEWIIKDRSPTTLDLQQFTGHRLILDTDSLNTDLHTLTSLPYDVEWIHQP
jgi:hypothetical protein